MRSQIKDVLGRLSRGEPAPGITSLIYHRVGGGSPDERDVTAECFREQVDLLAELPVVGLDEAVRRVEGGDSTPSVVLTFDDGFLDVHTHAWPLLRATGLPFTVYVATGYIGGTMHWDGSTAKDTGAPALHWSQLEDFLSSGLCTIGNHTHDHVRPERLDEEQLDRCTAELQQRLGVTPQHFAYTWGIAVPAMEPALRARFASAATGQLGRTVPGDDLLRMRRIPVRGSDPLTFFAAKMRGRLLPERAYGGLVRTAKATGARA